MARPIPRLAPVIGTTLSLRKRFISAMSRTRPICRDRSHFGRSVSRCRNRVGSRCLSVFRAATGQFVAKDRLGNRFSNFSGYGVRNIIDYQCAKPWVLNRPTPNPSERIRRLDREIRNYSGCQNPNPTAKMAHNLAFFGPVTASGEWLDGSRLERAKGFEPSTPTLARLCSTPELRPRSAEARLIGGFDLDCKPVNGGLSIAALQIGPCP